MQEDLVRAAGQIAGRVHLLSQCAGQANRETQLPLASSILSENKRIQGRDWITPTRHPVPALSSRQYSRI
jgi:hypothetical protein